MEKETIIKQNNKRKSRREIKRVFQAKLENNLVQNKSVFLEHLKREWEMIEKGAKREKLVREVKEVALVSAKTLLKLIAVGGVCIAVLVAPKIFAITPLFKKDKQYKKYCHKSGAVIKFHYLKRQKYIKFKKVDEDTYELEITDKGLARVLEDSFNLAVIYGNQKWDGKWRIVIFDIPEKFKPAREGFRRKLNEIGFYRVQDSVFITPFPCEKEIIFLSEIFNIAHFIYFMTTDYFINDQHLKQCFNL